MRHRCHPAAAFAIQCRPATVCRRVSRVPVRTVAAIAALSRVIALFCAPRPIAASSQCNTSVPQVYSSSVGGSDLVTVAGKSCRTSPSTMVRVASPVIVRSRFARKGAQRTSWSGSVSAAHTFAGGCRRLREKIRVQRLSVERSVTSASRPGPQGCLVHCCSLSGCSVGLDWQRVEVTFEGVQMPRPQLPVRLEPSVDGLELRDLQTVDPLLGRSTAGDKTRVAQHFQVLGNRWLAEPERVDQAAHARLRGAELVEDPLSGRLSKRCEGNQGGHRLQYSQGRIYMSRDRSSWTGGDGGDRDSGGTGWRLSAGCRSIRLAREFFDG